MDSINGFPCPLAPAECDQETTYSRDEKMMENEVGGSISPACSLPSREGLALSLFLVHKWE